MGFRRRFLKHYIHSNIQVNKVCALWKYIEQWASSRSNGLQKKFFKTIYTFNYTIEQSMRSVNVQWVVGFKEKEWLSEEFFWNIIQIQTWNWTKYAFCESTLSYGLQVEAGALRENFQNILHIETYNWRKYVLCESTLSGGLQGEGMAFRRNFLKHYTHSNMHSNKVCALWKYTEQWASSRSNGFQMKFFETLYTLKHTIEQSMLSVKVQWVVRFKQKQWVSEELLPHIIHIQTYNWTKYALCESILSSGLQAEVMAFRRNFSKQYTHSNIQLNKVCALWKYSEWWDSRRRNGFQKKFFETLYTFKHEIERSMYSVKVHWVVGFKQKQWVSEEVFQNILHIQTYNWTMYALCESTLCGWLQAEAMLRRRNFLKHYTHSNIQLNKVCFLWKYTEWCASSRSNGFQKKIFKTLYTFKHTIEQSMRSVKVQWVVGFKEKERLSEETFWNIIHIQTCTWTKYALCESTMSSGLQPEAMTHREILWNIIHIQT